MNATPASKFTRGRRAKVRIDLHLDEPLHDRVANFGNAKGWYQAETVRWLIERGLDHAECRS